MDVDAEKKVEPQKEDIHRLDTTAIKQWIEAVDKAMQPLQFEDLKTGLEEMGFRYRGKDE